MAMSLKLYKYNLRWTTTQLVKPPLAEIMWSNPFLYHLVSHFKLWAFNPRTLEPKEAVLSFYHDCNLGKNFAYDTALQLTCIFC